MYYKVSDLKKLVDVMSRSEKKYFGLFVNAFLPQGKNANYVRLFEALQKDTFEFPEFSSDASSEAVTTAKTRLFNNILRCMAFYHQEQSVETIIQNYLTQMEVLYRLSLPEQSLYLLQKARLLALQHEKFGLMLQLLEWERRLNIVLDEPIRTYADIKKEEKDIIARLQQLMVVEGIYSKIKEFKRIHGYVKGTMQNHLYQETIGAKDMPAENECTSKKTLFYFNLIHGLYNWMIFNHDLAYDFTKELLSSHIKVVMPDDYVAGVLEHVTSCICLGKFQAVLEGLEIVTEYIKRQKLDQSHTFSVRIDYYKMCYKMIVYNYSGDKDKLMQAIADAEEKLKTYDALLSKEMKLVITTNLMDAYLGVGDLDQVSRLWDVLFNKKWQSVRRNAYDNLYIFRLFNLLQNKFYWMIRSMALSASRYYKKFSDYQTRFPLEISIVSVFQRNINFEIEEDRKAVLNEIREILKQYIASLSSTTRFQEQYTQYEIWTESLYNEQPFHIEARKWHTAFESENTIQ